jgi:hypothetical protein
VDVREALEIVREQMDDDAVQADGTTAANLWTDSQIIRFLAEAQQEAAQRARLLFDDQTTAIVDIPIVASQAEYTLHHSIFDVRRVAYSDFDQAIHFTTADRLDGGVLTDDYGIRRVGRWRTRTEQRGRAYLLTHTPRGGIKLRLYPIPLQTTWIDSAGTTQPLTLKLSVYRRPVWPLRSVADRIEIHPDHHMRLLDWVFYRLYSKRDSDTYRPDKALNYQANFVDSFGIREDADVQRQQFESREPIVAGWGF